MTSDPPDREPDETPGERTFRLIVAYDGTNYAGWQRQSNGIAIQQLLEEALLAVTGLAATVRGSGRTDSGVHSRGQVASFRLATNLSPRSLGRALQSRLPLDVVLRDVREAPENFHAQRSAIGKRYRYCLDDGPEPNPFVARYAWRVRQTLDAARMQAAASRLVGTHDFKSFQSVGAERKTTVRTVTHARVSREESGFGPTLWFDVAANGFLYRMVRNMVGLLHEIGRGAREPAWVDEVLAAKSRSLRFPAAPPQGLFLWSVDYPDHAALGARQGRGVDDEEDAESFQGDSA